MKKLGYFLLLLIILSACTSGAGQKSAGDLPISAPGADQTTTGGDVTSDNQPSSASVLAKDPSVAPSPGFAVSQKGEALTPFQLQLEQGINQRKAAGLPVPSVKFEYQATSNDALLQIAGTATTSTNPTKVVSKTVIQFEGPEQAGYIEWPALVTEDNLPPEVQATVKEADYTEAYRKFLDEKIPGIWDKYEFGHEPRIYTFVETIETTYPRQNLLETNPMAAQEVTSTGQLLMGFTYTGPNINYTLGHKLEIPKICDPIFGLVCIGPAVVYDFLVGIQVDWALGLRLPAEATLIGPDQMIQGNDYNDFYSSFTTLDWSPQDYIDAKVASEAGNEFVLRLKFFGGLKAVIMDQDVCEEFNVPCNLDVNIDKSTSFTTPLGTGAYFPIPSTVIPIKDYKAWVLSWMVGLEVTPNLGSKEITADWQASGAASGSGSITYSEPGDEISLGKINACGSGPDNLAHIQLTNFQYHFNQFLINLAATSVFSIDAIKIVLGPVTFNVFDGKSWTDSIPITTVDFSPIIGKLDLRVGTHTECDWDFSCSEVGPDNKLELSIPVVDLTPPSTSLTASGTAGDNGWYVSDVQVGLSVADPPDGCGNDLKQIEYSFDGTSWNVYTVPFTLSNEGITTVHYRSIDYVGNVEPARMETIKIDKTPPTITGSPTTTPSAYGWYNTDVVIHFDAADAVSGIATVTPDQTLSGEGADQSVVGTAVDMAGLTASFTVTGIHIDKTLPTISITSPEAREYENTETFSVIWSAADSLAGMASESGNIDGIAVTNGQLMELLLLAPGPHTLTVEATDKADNTASESLVFSVSVDADGLLAALEYMCNLGWIDKHGICNSLEAKLSAAIDSINRGNMNAAENQLNAFLNELEAQKDKSINQSAYDVLTVGALYVIDHLE